MGNKSLRTRLLVFAVGLAVSGILAAIVHEIARQYLQQTLPVTFNQWLAWLYPRLVLIRTQASPAWWDSILQGVWFRIPLFFCLGFALWEYARPVCKQPLTPMQTIPLLRAKRITQVYFALSIWYASDWLVQLVALSHLNPFYQPVFLLKILHLPLLSAYVFSWLFGCLILSGLLVLARIAPVVNALIHTTLFVILHGYLISFHKIDHTYTAWIYIGFWMPLLILSTQKASLKGMTFVPILDLWAMQVSIGMLYAMAAAEKILVGGWAWLRADNLQGYLLDQGSTLGLLIAHYPWLCQILILGAWFFEASFLLAIFARQKIGWFLIAGVCFHWGTALLLQAGGLFSPWIAAYLVFLPWEQYSFSSLFSSKWRINQPK